MDKQDPEIKPLAASDLGEAYELCERALEHHEIGRERFKRAIFGDSDYDSALALGALRAGKLTAVMIAVQPSVERLRKDEQPGTARLVLFATDAQERGRGLAGLLYERIETELRRRGVREIRVGSSAFFSGLDLRYRRAAVFLLRRLYVPKEVVYDQLCRVADVDTDTSEAEATLGAQGLAFRRLEPADAGALRLLLESHFPGWLGTAAALGERRPEYSVNAAFCNGEIVAFSARDGNNFGPLGAAPAFRRKGLATVLVKRALRDVAGDGYDEMIIQVANFMYYARAFACPVLPVWRMVKDLQADPAVMKGKR